MSGREQLLGHRPAVRPGVRLSPALLRGRDHVHVVKEPESGRSFEVGPKEHFIISRLDGERSLGDIGDEYAARFGRRLGEGNWGQMLRLLHARGLLAGAPAPPATTGESEPSGLLAGSVRLVSDASATVDRLHRRVGGLLATPVVAPLLVAVAAMEAMLLLRLGELADGTGRLFRQPAPLLAVCTLLWLSNALHELAHGVTARRFGGSVTEIGLRWRLPVVLMYCTVDNYLWLPRRWHRVATAGAGAFMNLLVLLPFFPVWLALPDDATGRDALAGLLLLGSAAAWFNLLPLPPLDGYKIFSHTTGTTGCARESGRYLRLVARRALGRGDGPVGYPRRARAVYPAYAALVALCGCLMAAVVLALSHRLLADRFGATGTVLPLILLVAFGGAAAVGRSAHAARAARRAAGEPAGPEPAATGQPAPPARTLPRSATPGENTANEGEPVTRTTAPGPAGPAITLSGVRKAYGGVQAADGISLEIRRGEFFGLLGPNGAGKTTLVEIMEGLRRQDAGTVEVLGTTPWPRDVALLPRLGVQTQSSAFFVRLTAHEHLRTVAALYGVGGGAVDRTLALVGLTDQAGARVATLSGGQRQRLAIASALVHGPELIFLDEPTAALDPQARRALWQVLRELKGEGRTIVYTTHHLDEAEALCDRVAILVGGRVVALDTPHKLVGAAGAPTRLLVPADRMTVKQAEGITGVDRVTVQGGSVVLETQDAGPVLAAVNEVAGLTGVQTRTATLEDVYLELTGLEQQR